MSIAVVNHAELLNFADELGFPMNTKVKLDPGGIGYKYFDEWIRANVTWVSQLNFDPATHVRITEFATMTGQVPEPLFQQQYLEGEPEHNAFNTVEGNLTHVNRAAIQFVVNQTNLKYIVDYRVDDKGEGVVDTDNWLAVGLYPAIENTTLTYASDVKVEQIWITRLINRTDDSALLQKRAYAHDPKLEESYPWVDVGVLEGAEFQLWVSHNLPEASALEKFSTDQLRVATNNESN